MQSIRPLVTSVLLAAGFTSYLRAQDKHWVNAASKPDGKWAMRETRLLADLGVPIPKDDSLTRYGGLRHEVMKGTGFFRVEKVGDRWWMIDPDGGKFVFAGICSVKPETRYGAKEPFDSQFGTTDAWLEKTLSLFREHGFNGIGGFSDHETLRRAPHPMPYTVTLSLMSRFGRKLGITHSASGHTGYEADCLPVFHPDFSAFCQQECKAQLSAMAADPWLVGVFSDNELPIAKDMLDRMLKLDPATPAHASSRAAAEAFVKQRGGVTDEVRRDFVEKVFDAYFQTTTGAIRSVLPHHLCLGSRFHGPAKNASGVWKAAGRWCDVISMNYYDHWSPQQKHLSQWIEWSGKPCLITEFYVKGEDSGMANRSGAGWVVKTQEDRGAFYQNFVLGLLESKTCVGWHWFKYMDNDPANTQTDASNKDSNKGILSARYEPYEPLLRSMKEINERIYGIVGRLDEAK